MDILYIGDPDIDVPENYEVDFADSVSEVYGADKDLYDVMVWEGELERQLEIGDKSLDEAVEEKKGLPIEDQYQDIVKFLEEERNIFHELVEHSKDIVTVLSTEGRILYNSPAVEEVLGYNREETEGDDGFDYFHPEERSDLMEQYIDVIQGNKDSERTIFRMSVKDGGWKLVESDGRLLDSRQDRFVITTRDISERQEEMEERLRQEELISTMEYLAHDLKNPIQVLEARLDIANRRNSLDDYDVIKSNLEKLKDIIEDYIDVAKAGQYVEEKEEVNLGSVAEQVWRENHNLEADFSIEDSINFKADKTRVELMLDNLYKNSVEHGGDNVNVRLGAEDNYFYLEDDGEGIPENKRDRIFEKGFTTSESGQGLGMRIVENAVGALGWDIEVTESEEGGARFEIKDVEYC